MQGQSAMDLDGRERSGRGARIQWAIAETSLGDMFVAATAKGVCRLSFGEGREVLSRQFPQARLAEWGAWFKTPLTEIIAAVERPATAQQAEIALDLHGTAFQQRVWQHLCTIPAGETRSYGDLAAALGQPKASRAVGRANGANPVAVLVPCHRVVRADGGLGGYAYGEAIKEQLLRRERLL